jgi:acetyl esterase/lipase
MATSFVAGWLTTELALHHLGWLSVALLAFVQLGALEDAVGRVALGLGALSWVGLLVCARQARGTRDAVERAIAHALPEELHAPLAPELEQALARRIARSQLLFPYPFTDRRIERIDDILYAEGTDLRNQLDIYRPRQPVERAPVLLHVHGGGWVVGSNRTQGRPLLHDLATRGFVCVSINYRLSPRATFPDHLLDAKRALIWVRTHIAEYGGDPNCVIVTGGSAGAHLAALLALTANDPKYQPGFETVDTAVQGCIPFYGIYDLAGLTGEPPSSGLLWLWQRSVLKRRLSDAPELFAEASPFKHIHADAPPFFVIHGTHDSMAPVTVARSFVAALRRVSKEPVGYVELPGAQHSFDIFHSVRTHHVMYGVHRFLGFVVARHHAHLRAPSPAMRESARAVESAAS